MLDFYTSSNRIIQSSPSRTSDRQEFFQAMEGIYQLLLALSLHRWYHIHWELQNEQAIWIPYTKFIWSSGLCRQINLRFYDSRVSLYHRSMEFWIYWTVLFICCRSPSWVWTICYWPALCSHTCIKWNILLGRHSIALPRWSIILIFLLHVYSLDLLDQIMNAFIQLNPNKCTKPSFTRGLPISFNV